MKKKLFNPREWKPKNYEEFKDIIETLKGDGRVWFSYYSKKEHRMVMSWIKPNVVLNSNGCC